MLNAGDSLTSNKRDQWAGWNVPSHELIAVMTLMLLPVIGFVVAKLVTHAYVTRYFLPTAIGIALGLAFLYHRLLQGRLLITAVLVASLLGIFIVRQAGDARGLFSEKPNIAVAKSCTWALSVPDNTPIIISNPLLFLQCQHYAPPGLKTRLCYLMDLDAVRQTGKGTAKGALEKLREKVPIRVEDYRSFLSSHNRFYLYDSNKLLITKLLRDGVQLKVNKTLLEALVDDSLSGKAK